MGDGTRHIFSDTQIPVVINADDFGYSEEVNATVAEAIEKGCISSATVMANADSVDEALKLAHHFKQASFGVHLNLTEFRSLLPTHDVQASGLVDADGYFLGNGFRNLRPTPKLFEACYNELNQQLLLILQKGLRPSHLDSHHHIHTIPWLLPVMSALQRKYKIFRMRNTMNIYRMDPYNSPKQGLIAAKRIWQLTARSLGSIMTQRFTSLEIFMDDPSRSDFISAKSIELMCHPGQKGFEDETHRLLSMGPTVLTPMFQLKNYKNIFMSGNLRNTT